MKSDTQQADVVICGAGIAGIATAYFLTIRRDIRNVLLVDRRAPLSGYGIMASLAGADLLTAHVCGSELPDYVLSVDLSRYDHPVYQAVLQDWDAAAGQL